MNTQEEEVFKGRIDLGLWLKLGRFVRPYRRELIGLLILAGFVAGIDVALPILSGRVIAGVQQGGGVADLWRFGAGYAAAFFMLAICIFLFILFAGRITIGVSADIRQAAFVKLQSLQFAYFDKRNVGWLMARLTSDCNSLSRVFAWGLLDVTWGSIVMFAMAVAMFILNWQLALVVCTIAPVLFAVSWWFQIRILRTSRAIKKTNSLLTGAFNEGIQGVRTTRSLGREEANLEEFSKLTSEMYRQTLRSATLSAVFIPLVSAICSVGIGLALWRGGVDVIGGMELALLITFLGYAGNIPGPAQELANAITMIQNAGASAERVQGLLDEPVTIRDADDAAAMNQQGFNRIETITFENVSFGYTPETLVLRDFSLTVRAGQTIALVGATGGGKTTIVSLVWRFYEPTSGRILINGVDYRELPLAWLQGSLGMVLQQPHLFSGTVRENIRYGRLSASDEEIEQAARLTNAHGFIDRLEKRYDAEVGEGGNRLSTGQKQLVALARAVIADPKIFVMDEATSSVDTQAERDIQSAVEHVLAGRIGFVIAHRLSTIRRADVILVIDQGRVVEQGDHHSLINARGRYYELYTNQFVHEREEELMHGV